MKQVSSKIRLELAQYRELANFSQFGSDIDKETKARLDHGRLLMEVLKQRQYQPMDVIDQIVIIYAASGGFMEDVPVDKVRKFEVGLLEYMRHHYPEVEDAIRESGQLTEETSQALRTGILAYKELEAGTVREDGIGPVTRRNLSNPVEKELMGNG